MSYERVAAAGTIPAQIRFYYGSMDLFNVLSLRTAYRAKMIKSNDGESQLDDLTISQDELDITKELLYDAISKIGQKMFKMAQAVENPMFYDSLLTSEDAIKTVTVGSGGTGYTQGDVLTVVGTGAAGGTVTVTTVNAGVITEISLTTKGYGYTATTLQTTGGTGSSATITVSAIEDVNILSVASYGFHILDNNAFNTNVLPSLDGEIKRCLREYCMMEWYAIVGSDVDWNLHSKLFEKSILEASNLTFQLRKPTMTNSNL